MSSLGKDLHGGSHHGELYVARKLARLADGDTRLSDRVLTHASIRDLAVWSAHAVRLARRRGEAKAPGRLRAPVVEHEAGDARHAIKLDAEADVAALLLGLVRDEHVVPRVAIVGRVLRQRRQHVRHVAPGR